MSAIKERTKTMVRVEAGVIQTTPGIELVLDNRSDWMDYATRARTLGENPRLPLFYRAPDSTWWWMGRRSVTFVKGAERVCILGRQRRANRQLLDFTGRGEMWVWVVDDQPALSPGNYSAPWPLETREDAKRYVDAGIVWTSSLPHCARVLGWMGHHDVLNTVKIFRDTVIAVWEGKDGERYRAKIPNVVFPNRAEYIGKRMAWGDVVGLIVKQGEEITELKAQAEKTGKELGFAIRRLETVERHATETKRRHAAELETLRGEVETLRGLVI